MVDLFGCWILTGLALAGPAGLCAQQYPLNEKSRYEAELENKINESILKILGPNKAKVIVQADMDFGVTEKIRMEGGAAVDQENFKWAGIGPDLSKKAGLQLLPGFPVPSAQGGAPAGPQSYAKQLIYPASLVKKLTVSLVVNKSLSPEEAGNITSFVSDVMNLDSTRGDAIITVRATFASMWKTIWFMPEAVSVIFRYGIISLAVIVAMLSVMFGIIRLSASMKSLGRDQQQISMDFGSKGGETVGVEEAVPGRPELAGPEGAAASGQGKEGEAEAFFNVKLNQVPVLVHIMAREKPENIALISAHLAPDIRTDFLKRLPPQVSSEVIASMAEIRFVKPAMIEAIKDELEKRFSGAVGGIDKVFEVMDMVSGRVKKDMLLELERRHPEVAGKVRAGVLLFDDLYRLDENELSMLVPAVKVEDWGVALVSAEAGFRERVKRQMMEKTRQMMEQIVKYGGSSREKSDAATEAVVQAAARLIKEGRIRNPLELKNAVGLQKQEIAGM